MKKVTWIQFHTELPVSQYLVLPNPATRTKLIESSSAGSRNSIVDLLKPSIFVPTGEINSMMDHVVKDNYETYLASADYSLVDDNDINSLINTTDVQLLTQSSTERDCSDNLEICLLTELRKLIPGSMIIRETNMAESYPSFYPTTSGQITS
ncbi:unnamed protein product [Ambrosiozyma monospora]|uniref:Unnamed protein product n=1 Tax=Ambrosiozyma monospora TaxID=43982 RepID=A0ACB5T3E8_AMBMO|nr:unnamed protein product [Ambrosiozyma monospora]